MSVKRHIALFTCFILAAFMLVGCSSGPSPLDTVQTAMESSLKGDIEDAMKFMCEKMREEAPSKEQMDFLKETLSKIEFDFADVKYELIEETNDTAKVKVLGSITAKTPTGEEKDEIDEVVTLIKEDGKWVICE